LISTLVLRERVRSSPKQASRRQWLRFSTPAQCPRTNSNPLRRSAFLPLQTRKVIACLGAGPGTFIFGSMGLDDEDAAGKGKIDSHRFNRGQAYATLFEPTVSGVGMDKRGS
jgi:hypothetical protein